MTDDGRRGVIFALLLLTVVASVVVAFIVATRTDKPMVLPQRGTDSTEVVAPDVSPPPTRAQPIPEGTK